jgi:hypothetical protein
VQLEQFHVRCQQDEDQADFFRVLIRNLEKRNDAELLLQYQLKYEEVLKKRKTSLAQELNFWFFKNSKYFNSYTDHVVASDLFSENVKAYLGLHELVILRNYLECLNRSTVDDELKKLLESEYKALLDRKAHADSDVASLYRQLIVMFEADSPDLPSFEAFKQAFLSKARKLERIDQVILWETSRNYLHALVQVNGTQESLSEMLNWQQEGNENQYSYFGDSMPVYIYMSFFFLVRVHKNKLNLYLHFEQNHSHKLMAKYREKTVQLCQGFLLLDQGKYKQAFKVLDEYFPANFVEQPQLGIFSKSLRAMIHTQICLDAGLANWDEEQDQALSRAIDNLEQYLTREVGEDRQHFSEQDILGHKNFANALEQTRKILKSWRPVEKQKHINRVAELEKIIKKNPIAHRHWLTTVVLVKLK